MRSLVSAPETLQDCHGRPFPALCRPKHIDTAQFLVSKTVSSTGPEVILQMECILKQNAMSMLLTQFMSPESSHITMHYDFPLSLDALMAPFKIQARSVR